jgi:DNA-binding NtrC family response regulator
MAKIMVVEDDQLMLEAIQQIFKEDGHVCAGFSHCKNAIDEFYKSGYDLVITDLKLPDDNGIQLLQKIKELSPDVPVILITAFATIENAIEALQKGAYDYIQKPFRTEKLKTCVNRALQTRALALENEYLKASIKSTDEQYVWGPSKASQDLYQMLLRIATTDSTVLLLGETGSGKEIVAKTIHKLSPRASKPFIAVNCAAISAGLLESELFGHEKGAFTGADSQRKGRFEIAEGGTIMLDEISEIPQGLQAKLLRVIQFKQFERVGSNITRNADVRIIATTNRDLQKTVQKGAFREDLFHRLNVLPVKVPSLRERKQDIPELIKCFVKRRFPGKKVKIEKDAMELFMQYPWPGNIRELENVIERGVILYGEAISAKQVENWLFSQKKLQEEELTHLIGRPIDEIELMLIRLNVAHFGSQEKAASVLGISSRTIREKLKSAGIIRQNAEISSCKQA